MNEPVRLSKSGSADVRALLEAGRRERAPAGKKEAAIAAAALSASTTTALVAWRWRRWLWKVGAMIAVGTGLVGFLGPKEARLFEDEPRGSGAASKTFEPAPLVASAPAPPSAPSPSAASASPRVPAPAPAPPPTELELLRQARRLRAGGDATGALAVLAEHASAYPGGVLREEAEALRVDALAASGDAAGAEAAARRFLRDHPASPYRERVRSVASLPAP